MKLFKKEETIIFKIFYLYYNTDMNIKDNKEKIDFNNLVLAIRNTLNNRNTELDIVEIKEQLKNMKTNNRLISLWEQYQKSAPYSKNIKYEFSLQTLEYITDILGEKFQDKE